jgi:hypothetical protein
MNSDVKDSQVLDKLPSNLPIYKDKIKVGEILDLNLLVSILELDLLDGYAVMKRGISLQHDILELLMILR